MNRLQVRRDRRKAKQSGYRREPKPMGSKVGHGTRCPKCNEPIDPAIEDTSFTDRLGRIWHTFCAAGQLAKFKPPKKGVVNKGF